MWRFHVVPIATKRVLYHRVPRQILSTPTVDHQRRRASLVCPHVPPTELVGEILSKLKLNLYTMTISYNISYDIHPSTWMCQTFSSIGFGYMLHTSKSHSTECLDSTEMSVLKQIVEVQVSCNLAVGAMHTLGLSEFSHPYRHWSDDGGYNLQHTDRTLITHDYTISCSLLIQSEVASKRSSRGALKTYCAFIFAAGFSCLELPLKHAGATSCIGQIAADSRTHLFKSLWYMS